MSALSFRGFTYMFLIVFLIWSSNFEACIARRGKHWRQSSRDVSDAVYKKKGKNYGNGHNKNHGGGGSKPKPPSHKGTPSPPYPPPPQRNTPKPPPSNEDNPTTPPPKPYNGGHSSTTTTFNVLDFGAKGDGKTDDTKVNSLNLLMQLLLLTS